MLSELQQSKLMLPVTASASGQHCTVNRQQPVPCMALPRQQGTAACHCMGKSILQQAARPSLQHSSMQVLSYYARPVRQAEGSRSLQHDRQSPYCS